MDSAACSVNIPRVLKTRAPVEADLAPADRELLAGRKVVVVMPAYNAARTLEMTWRQIPKAWVDQVVLVDDFSRDSTVEVARTLKLNVIAHPHNVGYGGNQKTCYMEALRQRADVVVMLHPDGQYDPTLGPDHVRPVLRGDYDVVLCSRFLTTVENLVLGRRFAELHTGYRAYSQRFLETIPFLRNSNDFAFDTEVIAQAVAFGFKVGEVAVETRYFPEASELTHQRSYLNKWVPHE